MMKWVSGGILLAVVMVPVFGAEAKKDEEVYQIEEVRVRGAALVQENLVSGYAVGGTVVGAQQLEDLNAGDIEAALRVVPGVNVSRYNKVGSYGGAGGGAVFVRGMGASRPGGELVMLVDGAPRYNAVFSHPLLDILSVESAESVRVYKGVEVPVFGNGFAAVEVVPRRVRTKGISGEVSAAYGTDETVAERVSVGGKFGGFDFGAGQSLRRSEGHRKNAGGELQDYFLRTGWEINGNWDLSVFAERTKNFAEDPGAVELPFHMGDYFTDDWFGVATLANRFGGTKGVLKAYWNRGHAEWLDQGMAETGAVILNPAATTKDTVMDWDLYGLQGREELPLWAGAVTTAGADFDVMSGAADFSTYDPAVSTRFGRESFWLFSPYAGVVQEVGRKDGIWAKISGAVRFYEHEVFGSEWGANAGVVAGVNGTEVRAAWARGVNYPGLNVAAFSEAVVPGLYNDPTKREAWRDLEAERLDHWEIGVSQSFGERVKAELTGFWDEGRNRYVLAFAGGGAPSGFENISTWRNHGVEGSVMFSPWRGMSVFAGGTWLRCSVEGMPYAPEWTASAGFAWQATKRIRICADMLYQDAMFVNPANAFARNTAGMAGNPRVGSALVVNAKVSFAFEWKAMGVRRGEVFLSGENLTDCDYEYRPGYPMPGIGGMLGLKLGW